MTKAQPRRGETGTGAFTDGIGQVRQAAGPVTPVRTRIGTAVRRVVPAHLACRIGAGVRAGKGNAWAAVVSIALRLFALVFSELIPVRPLADISGHLRVSIGIGGLMVVVPGTVSKRDPWSRKQHTPNTLRFEVRRLAGAATRKELPCPTRL